MSHNHIMSTQQQHSLINTSGAAQSTQQRNVMAQQRGGY